MDECKLLGGGGYGYISDNEVEHHDVDDDRHHGGVDHYNDDDNDGRAVQAEGFRV